MPEVSDWSVNIVRGDELRKLVAAEINRAAVDHCLAFIREYASADIIDEPEFCRLISKFFEDCDA